MARDITSVHGQSRQASCCSLACVLACCVSVGISKFEITVFPRRCASPPLGCPPPIRKGGHKARRNPEVAVGAARSAAWYSTSGGRVALEGLGLQPVAVPAQYWTPILAGAVTRPGGVFFFLFAEKHRTRRNRTRWRQLDRQAGANGRTVALEVLGLQPRWP